MNFHAICEYKHLKAKVVANVAVLVEQVLATPNMKTGLENMISVTIGT